MRQALSFRVAASLDPWSTEILQWSAPEEAAPDADPPFGGRPVWPRGVQPVACLDVPRLWILDPTEVSMYFPTTDMEGFVKGGEGEGAAEVK